MGYSSAGQLNLLVDAANVVEGHVNYVMLRKPHDDDPFVDQ